MRQGEKILALILAVVLAFYPGVPFQMSAAETETEALAGIQVIDGEFCSYSEDAELDEEKTSELREAAQEENGYV